MRLSELLERIRPAGTPGASAGGEVHRETAVAEIGAIAQILAGFESDADAVVADARRVAEQIRVDAERRAQQVRADLPDRIAVARAGGASDERVRSEAALAAVEDETGRRLAALETRSVDTAERAVAAALETIWRQVPASQPDGRP